VLRTRPPRSTPERARARLACIRHAASVDPEPGSNSPPMLHWHEAWHRVETLVPPAPPKRHRTSQRRWPPKGSLLLRVMATRVATGMLLCARPKSCDRHLGCPRRHPTLRSLRLRHPTRWLLNPASARSPIRPLRQLVNVLLRFGARRPYPIPAPHVKGHEQGDASAFAPLPRT
jgi:hypothetical protein